MKKIIALAASVVLAGSMFAFAGCKDEEDSKVDTTIPGDYQEVSKDEASAALTTIDPSKAFPAITTDENAKLGLEFGSNLTVNANMPFSMTVSGQTGQGKMIVSASEDVKYNLVISDKATKYIGAGYANGSVNLDATLVDAKINTGASAKVNLYNDTDYIYAALNELKVPPQDIEQGGTVAHQLQGTKYKFSIEELVDIIMSTPDDDPNQSQTPSTPQTPQTPSTNPNPSALYAESEGSATENIDFAQYIEMLEGFKVKVALDQKSGLKVKLSATKESYDAILAYLETSMGEDPDAAQTLTTIKQSLTVNKFNVDVYLAFAESGLFEKAAIDLDIDVKVKGEVLTTLLQETGADFKDSTFAVKGGLYFSTYDGSVSLPEGIATDETYVEMPLSGTKEEGNKQEEVA